MIEILKSFWVGVLVGTVFTYFKFPVPAPATFAGVAAVAGVFAGYFLIKKLGL